MSAYETGHLALMHGFFLLGCLFACWLIGAGVLALWRCITSAPDGREDRGGWHKGGQS